MNRAFRENYEHIFELALLEEVEAVGVYKEVKRGQPLMDIGDTITAMPLLLSGAIKILREDSEGDELLVYFIEKGGTCAMTFSCCMGKSKSEIRAVAEMDTELLMVPVQQMEVWMGKYKSWQQFILESYHTRMMELLETVDTLAFLKMDERLSRYLKDKVKMVHKEILQVTHQEIAYDLHTSRVVVSRLLKKMENEGKIRLQRNQIKVLEE